MAFLRKYNEGFVDDPGDPAGANPGAAPAVPAPGVAPTTNYNWLLGPGGGGAGGVGGGGGGVGIGAGRPVFNFEDVPGFNYPKFKAPTLEDAQSEPGYQFRSDAGQDAIERSAAARGVARTGGTIKDLAEWNQNFASSEYSNVFNRALGVYDRTYQGAKDAYAPLYGQWQMGANAELQAALAQYAIANRQTGGGGGGGLSAYEEWLNEMPQE